MLFFFLVNKFTKFGSDFDYCVIQSLQEYEKVLDVFSITLMRSQAEVEVNIIVTKHSY